MRFILAVLMAVHGIAHVVGFLGAWRLAPDGIPYKTTVLAGHLDLGDAGIRVVGILWLALAVSFVATAVGALGVTSWWTKAALGLALVSLALSASEWPEARLGVVLNIVIITLTLGRWIGRP